MEIKDWQESFETNETRRLKHLRFVLIPNKQDGDGYTELLSHKNGAAHFGAWTALLQLASKAKRRGTLLRDDGTEHNSGSLERITRIPAQIWDEALPRLVSVGWLAISGNPRKSPKSSEKSPREGKGIEGKGIEGSVRRPALPKSLDEVREHWRTEGFTKSDPEDFWDHFEGNGWVQGAAKAPIKNWHRAASRWERMQKAKPPTRRDESRQAVIVGTPYQAKPPVTFQNDDERTLCSAMLDEGKSLEEIEAAILGRRVS